MTGSLNTALIVGDMQSGILANFPFSQTPLGPLRTVLSAARAHGLLTVFVRTELRPSGIDVSDNNLLFKQFHEIGTLFHEGAGETAIASQLDPQSDDPIVTKRRTSVFTGTDFDLLLRAQRIETLVLTGVATSAMIAATLLDALDRDYRVTVLSDACADDEPDVHDFLMERVFPARGAQVMTSTAWINQLEH